MLINFFKTTWSMNLKCLLETQQGGIYLFELYNTYAASGVTLLWMAMCECVAVGWVYGVDRFYDDMRSMLGFTPHNYFRLCYKYLIPIFTFVSFLFIKYLGFDNQCVWNILMQMGFSLMTLRWWFGLTRKTNHINKKYLSS